MSSIQDQAKDAFRIYLEAVMASVKSPKELQALGIGFNETAFSFLEKHMSPPEEGFERFRRRLVDTYFDCRKTNRTFGWEDDETVRDAMVRFLLMASYDDYLIATGVKKIRSIDDPWEAK